MKPRGVPGSIRTTLDSGHSLLPSLPSLGYKSASGSANDASDPKHRRQHPQVAAYDGEGLFDSKKPIECLRFLSVFKKQLDDNGISEGAAMKIWPILLSMQ